MFGMAVKVAAANAVPCPLLWQMFAVYQTQLVLLALECGMEAGGLWMPSRSANLDSYGVGGIYSETWRHGRQME